MQSRPAVAWNEVLVRIFAGKGDKTMNEYLTIEELAEKWNISRGEALDRLEAAGLLEFRDHATHSGLYGYWLSQEGWNRWYDEDEAYKWDAALVEELRSK